MRNSRLLLVLQSHPNFKSRPKQQRKRSLARMADLTRCRHEYQPTQQHLITQAAKAAITSANEQHQPHEQCNQNQAVNATGTKASSRFQTKQQHQATASQAPNVTPLKELEEEEKCIHRKAAKTAQTSALANLRMVMNVVVG